MTIFTKLLWWSYEHIIREYPGEEMKLFLNGSPLTIVNLLLWPFKGIQSLEERAFNKFALQHCLGIIGTLNKKMLWNPVRDC